MSIFKDISNHLHYNDCVILPNFGAFVLKSKSAYIEDNEFFPPSKYVSFNSMLKDNDGLLAKFISEERKISYKKSLKLISDEVKLLNEKLSEDLIFDTEYLGIFELKEKNTLIFNPDFSINFDSSVFGLNSFVRKPIINISSKRAADKSQFDTNNLLRYAAIFISILGLSYFGYFNYNNYLNNEKLKNIAIAQEKILENVQTATFNLGDLPPINVNVKAPIIKDNSTYYSVIAGAFRSRRNAEKHLNTLIIDGYQASYTTVNPKGLFRVAYARLKTRKEAAELILKIKTSGQDAWLLIEN
ncbi:MAG: SPOR domain-containing protein [Bacteroidota bacterium]|nr:SPOR domain-containing protein [Bacteroidota bacterium]